MATTDEKKSVVVELYDLSITERKDDRVGRVITSKSLKIDDIVTIAVNRRTDLNAVTLKSSFEILRDLAAEQICNGASVDFGLGHFNLRVTGVFYGDNAQWDSSKHNLYVRATPTSALRSQVSKVTVNLRGMASSGTFVNSVMDVTSGEENARLTPGGAVNLIGTKMKIAGDNPEIGIHLINENDNSVTLIPTNAIATNSPSKITFVVPATLPAGDYKLRLTTQFSNTSTLLKEPRTYTLDYILNV
ncbi:MAG: DUF4469 domain-containing protein [Dysgonamonadaceae bacterium]